MKNNMMHYASLCSIHEEIANELLPEITDVRR